MKKNVEQTRSADASGRSVEVKRRALELGFDAVGIATLEANAHAAELDRWLAAGYAGTMTYLHRQADKRKHPVRIMPGARVAVVTLTNYFHGSTDPGRKPGDPGNPTRSFARARSARSLRMTAPRGFGEIRKGRVVSHPLLPGWSEPVILSAAGAKEAKGSALRDLL